MGELTVDQQLILEARKDARQTRLYGIGFIILAAVSQLLHFVKLPVQGFPFMVIIAGIIFLGAGILFIMGSYTVPTNRSEFVGRLQKIMLTLDPERRLWAAQRLIGYAKSANFTKNDILRMTQYTVAIIQDPPVADIYKEYIAGDHLILLREMAVNIKMDRNTRREFQKIIRPLNKVKGLSDEAYELLADALAFHPDKLAVQAFSDLKKINEEDEQNEDENK
ncbi:MAG: hypothetical protein ACXAE3_10225 [Candidatus Kariarchaeaceae archaeon]|jgi:hypothetical protein